MNNSGLILEKQQFLSEYTDANGEKLLSLLEEDHNVEANIQDLGLRLEKYKEYELLQLQQDDLEKKREVLEADMSVLKTIFQYGEDRMKELLLSREMLKAYPIYQVQVKQLEQEKEDIEKSLENINKKIEEINSGLLTLEQNRKELLELGSEWLDLHRIIIDLNQKREECEKSRKILLTRCEEIDHLKSLVSNTIMPEKLSQLKEENCDIPKYWPLKWKLENLSEIFSPYKELVAREQQLRQRLSEAEMQENELKNIIELGRSYILKHDDNGPCKCPLCQTPFDNVELLFQATMKMSKSFKTTFVQELEEISREKSSLDIKYVNWVNAFHKQKKACLLFLEEEQLKVDQKLKIDKDELEKLDMSLDNAHLSISKLSVRIKNYGLTIDQNFNIDEIEKWYQDNKENYSKKRTDLLGVKHTKENRLSEVLQESTTLFLNIATIKEIEIEFAGNVLLPKALSVWNNSPDKELLKQNCKEIEREIINSKEELNHIKDVMACFSGFSLTDKAQCENNREIAKSKRLKLRDEILTLKKKSDIAKNEDISLDKLNDLLIRISERFNQLKIEAEMLKSIKNEDVEGYFRSFKNVNKNRNEKAKRKSELAKEYKAAQLKQNEAADALESKLQNYFAGTLFNEIYKKIDPHPIMKDISYEISTTTVQDKIVPELRFIAEDNNNRKYSPEWYFSTAQLNVVSLSAFLSRALSGKGKPLPLDFVMIDDPVGHFDDMNILDFSDMIRCVLEQTKKQIIITTHDETVYQIFRRKLSPEYYNSCFLTIE